MSVKANFTVSAPGKVILFGEHSVVYKKAAVSTAISRRLFVTVSNADTEEVKLNLPQLNSEIAFNLKQMQRIVKEECPLNNSGEMYSILKPDMIDFISYIQSLKENLKFLGLRLDELPKKTADAYIGILFVLRGMCQKLNCNLIPFSLEIKSELEVGTGIGSSAAFAVAISAAFLQYCKCLEISNNDVSALQGIQGPISSPSEDDSLGFSLHEKGIINNWAFCVEKIMHGRPSGIDNTTCTFGSVVKTSLDNNTTEGLKFDLSDNVPKITLLLISTGVSRNTVHLVAKVRTLREENCAATDAILNAMDVIAKEAFKTLDALGINDKETTTYTGLYKSLGKLMELNHGLLRTLGVSHDSLENIISACGRHGLASKLTGAGGGGYAIALVPPNVLKRDLEELKTDLNASKYEVTEINIAEEGVRMEKMF